MKQYTWIRSGRNRYKETVQFYSANKETDDYTDSDVMLVLQVKEVIFRIL